MRVRSMGTERRSINFVPLQVTAWLCMAPKYQLTDECDARVAQCLRKGPNPLSMLTKFLSSGMGSEWVMITAKARI